MSENKNSVAVIGAGVAGIVSSLLLQSRYQVTLYEKEKRIGGHTNTFVVENGEDAGLSVDTGFIVLNDKTYPNFHKLLASLGVEVRFSDMSFGFECEEDNLQYSGRGINGLFAQRRNFFNPSYISFLFEISRFAKVATESLRIAGLSGRTLAQFLVENNFSRRLIDHYVVPMGAAIWSAPADDILNFPASTFINFFANHGLLSLKDRPRWQTVVGGSHSYLKAFLKSFSGKVVLNSAIDLIERNHGQVKISFKDGSPSAIYDQVVIATHADQALGLLKDPSEEERLLLGQWSYQSNHTVLHTDQRLLPDNRRAWASWNYYRGKGASGSDPLEVTYYMNLLQGLRSNKHYCVTLNSKRNIDPKLTLLEIDYEHPVFSARAVDSQTKIAALNGANGTWYCGSYMGYGFHEDAVKSSLSVVSSMGIKF